MSRESLLANTLVELADTLVDDFDVVELLTMLTDRSVEVFDQDLAGSNCRWPLFKVEGLKAGIQSVHALPMHLRGRTIGALNLFRTDKGAMDETDVHSAQAFADVATIAILQHRSMVADRVIHEELRHALDSRVLIEQSKGLLAEPGRIDMEQAFDLLRGYARHNNRRIVDVAQDLVDGRLPAYVVKGPAAPPHAA